MKTYFKRFSETFTNHKTLLHVWQLTDDTTVCNVSSVVATPVKNGLRHVYRNIRP